MSNLGLELALKARGIRLVRVAVGDRYVVDAMRRGGFNLGGEQSGHIILLDHSTTGDGLLAGAQLLRLAAERQRPLSALRAVLTRLPQVLRSLRVPDRRPIDTLPGIAALMARIEAALGERGRLLVRYSGTEPLIRVMLEGEDLPRIEQLADELVAALQSAFGVPA